MKIITIEKNNEPNFGKFIRISGNKNKLKQFRHKLNNESQDSVSFIKNKSKSKAYLYIFSDKDLDKFIDLIEKGTSFLDLRLNIEKIFDKKPQKLNLKDAKLKLQEKDLI